METTVDQAMVSFFVFWVFLFTVFGGFLLLGGFVCLVGFFGFVFSVLVFGFCFFCFFV